MKRIVERLVPMKEELLDGTARDTIPGPPPPECQGTEPESDLASERPTLPSKPPLPRTRSGTYSVDASERAGTRAVLPEPEGVREQRLLLASARVFGRVRLGRAELGIGIGLCDCCDGSWHARE